MKKIIYATLLSSALAVAAVPVYADTPASLRGKHDASSVVTGKVTLYRVQVQGLEIGPADDRLDAEVLVVLDSAPDMVFGIRMHEDVTASSQSMVDLLHDAYKDGTTVTLQYPMAPGKKHNRINWVQLGK